MNINQDIFYSTTITNEEKEQLYNADTNIISLAIGLHRASGKELSIGYIAPQENSNDIPTAYMVTKEGFPALYIGRLHDGQYYVKTPYLNLLERGKDKHAIRSTKVSRLVKEMKDKRLAAIILNTKSGYGSRYINNTYGYYRQALKFSVEYESKLTGSQQYDLLKVLLGNKPIADIPDVIREEWRAAYEKFTTQDSKIEAAKTELAEVFSREAWAVYSSVAGVIVGTVKSESFGHPFTEVVPFRAYKSVHDIQDDALREDLITTLTMCRTNREQSTRANEFSYFKRDPDKFFPIGDIVLTDSQSVSYNSVGGTGIFATQLFMVAR